MKSDRFKVANNLFHNSAQPPKLDTKLTSYRSAERRHQRRHQVCERGFQSQRFERMERLAEQVQVNKHDAAEQSATESHKLRLQIIATRFYVLFLFLGTKITFWELMSEVLFFKPSRTGHKSFPKPTSCCQQTNYCAFCWQLRQEFPRRSNTFDRQPRERSVNSAFKHN